jgi:hypothetical protein
MPGRMLTPSPPVQWRYGTPTLAALPQRPGRGKSPPMISGRPVGAGVSRVSC